MPIRYRVDHEARLVVAAGFGRIGDAEVFGYQAEIASRADIRGYDELMDMTGATGFDVPSPERVRELARVAASTDMADSPSRFAIVAPGDAAFGLGRMFQIHRGLDPRSVRRVGVFRSMDEALAFLGLEHAPSPPAP